MLCTSYVEHKDPLCKDRATMAIMFLLVTDVLLHGRSKWLIKLIGIHI